MQYAVIPPPQNNDPIASLHSLGLNAVKFFRTLSAVLLSPSSPDSASSSACMFSKAAITPARAATVWMVGDMLSSIRLDISRTNFSTDCASRESLREHLPTSCATDMTVVHKTKNSMTN